MIRKNKLFKLGLTLCLAVFVGTTSNPKSTELKTVLKKYTVENGDASYSDNIEVVALYDVIPPYDDGNQDYSAKYLTLPTIDDVLSTNGEIVNDYMSILNERVVVGSGNTFSGILYGLVVKAIVIRGIIYNTKG